MSAVVNHSVSCGYCQPQRNVDQFLNYYNFEGGHANTISCLDFIRIYYTLYLMSAHFQENVLRSYEEYHMNCRKKSVW